MSCAKAICIKCDEEAQLVVQQQLQLERRDPAPIHRNADALRLQRRKDSLKQKVRSKGLKKAHTREKNKQAYWRQAAQDDWKLPGEVQVMIAKFLGKKSNVDYLDLPRPVGVVSQIEEVVNVGEVAAVVVEDVKDEVVLMMLLLVQC